jgi:hypothetical protein
MNDKKARGLFLSVLTVLSAQHMSGSRFAFQEAGPAARARQSGAAFANDLVSHPQTVSWPFLRPTIRKMAIYDYLACHSRPGAANCDTVLPGARA